MVDLGPRMLRLDESTNYQRFFNWMFRDKLWPIVDALNGTRYRSPRTIYSYVGAAIGVKAELYRFMHRTSPIHWEKPPPWSTLAP